MTSALRTAASVRENSWHCPVTELSWGPDGRYWGPKNWYHSQSGSLQQRLLHSTLERMLEWIADMFATGCRPRFKAAFAEEIISNWVSLLRSEAVTVAFWFVQLIFHKFDCVCSSLAFFIYFDSFYWPSLIYPPLCQKLTLFCYVCKSGYWTRAPVP